MVIIIFHLFFLFSDLLYPGILPTKVRQLEDVQLPLGADKIPNQRQKVTVTST